MESKNKNFKIQSSQCDYCSTIYSAEQIHNLEVLMFRSDAKDKQLLICDKCIDECTKEKDAISKRVTKNGKELDIKEFTPRKMKAHLDDYVIGQDNTKIILSTAVYNHMKRINELKKNKETIIEKSNIIMVGPTGTGKSHSIKALAKKFNLPLVIEDVTNITSAGYVGRDVDDLLRNLVLAADGDVEKAQYGIIYLDEGDKLRKPGELNSGKKDVNGEGVQQALLKMLEGSKNTFKMNDRSTKTVTLDTTNVLFIIGGAFVGIDKIVDKRLKEENKKTHTVGILGDVSKHKEYSVSELMELVSTEDLEKFGMTPEMLGRFPITTTLTELTEEQLCRIITEPKNAILEQFKANFELDGVTLTFSDEAIKAVAKAAIKSKRGARSIRTVMEKTLSKAMFEIPGSDITEVKIDENLESEYIFKQNMEA